MANPIDDALAELGPHEARLYGDLLAWTAANLERLRLAQDPPPPRPETAEEADALLGRLFGALLARLSREGALELWTLAAATADGDSERAQAVLERVLYRSVVRTAGGPEPALHEAFLRLDDAAESILRAEGGWRGRERAFAYLGALVAQRRDSEGHEGLPEGSASASQALPAACEREVREAGAECFEAAQARARSAGATARELELLQAFLGEGTVHGAARALGLKAVTARVHFRNLLGKLERAV